MRVIVKGYGDFKRLFKHKSTIELREGAKIKDLIVALGENVRTQKNACLKGCMLEESTAIILVNGRNIHALNGYDTILKEDDLVTFIPVLIGG
ncbi:MAG: MoaD/ThiS family protein [Candidatus Jordarchaeaceae archaeon]